LLLDRFHNSAIVDENESRNLKTFVANRVVIIQELTELNKWHHVPLEQNPADIISRGLDPEKIQQSDLWWLGPTFLEVPAVNFPRYVNEIHNCEPYQRELKDNQVESMCFLVQNNEIIPMIDKCSSFLKLQEILAWCVHFKEKIPLHITTGNLIEAELSTALYCFARNVQSVYFTKEIRVIERGQQLPDSSNLLTLFPFLDERKILCVGGRLRHSNLLAEQKHPMLIPNNHLICDLIIKHYHVSYLHTGTEATLANIRTKFCIVNGRSKVKRVIKQCIKCLKVNANGKNQMMADLPSARVSIAKVFNKVGLDFCGPFLIKLIPEDSEDLIAIAPAMFFKANSSAEVIDLDLNDLAKFQRRVRFRAKLFKDLKSRFRKEYLGLLAQKRSKPISHKMKVGEIVFVENPNKKSLYWPLAKVLELLPDRDGNIRTLKLKCGNAEIIRPVQRLFPLEIQPEELPIAIVGMERVPEPSTLSEVPVAYTGEEVNPELTEVNPAMDSCKFSRCGRKIKPPQKLDLLNLTIFFES
ncbi:integrase catalytic domain-containing protein, partial [Trichonephila clavata]